MSDDQIIIDASDLRKYRTELPNLYDDSDLDVYEFRLLAHYKRVGKCTESAETTAKKCRMSAGKVSEARAALAEKKFILLEEVSMGGGRYRYNVLVKDRWIENFARYSGLSMDEIAAQLQNSTPSRGEGSPSQSPSRGEGKKELKKDFVVVVNAGENFKIYEQEIGGLTPMIADAIRDAEKTYPLDWIPEAIAIAVASNKRSWKYVEGILKNCKAKNIRPSLNKLEANNGNTGKYSSGTTKAGASRRAKGQPVGNAGGAGVERKDAESTNDPQAAERHRQQWEQLRDRAKVPAVS